MENCRRRKRPVARRLLHFIRLSSIIRLSIVCLLLDGSGAPPATAAKPQIIVDADTANEIDDVYAILRLLWQDKFEIVGLNSAQWFHRQSGDQTVHQSQELNFEILHRTGRQDVTTYLGANDVFGHWWGSQDPIDSPAAQNIIARARALPEGEKLTVVCLGAFTNLALALALSPDIVPRIAAYVMGYHYDFERHVWSKGEFNVQRDYHASEYVLNQPDLELHVMTATTSSAMLFDRTAHLRPAGPTRQSRHLSHPTLE
jgi:purine nucleosidase